MENEKKYLTPTIVGDESVTVGKPYEVVREYVGAKGTLYRIVDDDNETISVITDPYEESPIAIFLAVDMSGRYAWKFCHKDGTLI